MSASDPRSVGVGAVTRAEPSDAHHLEVYVPTYCLQGQDLPGHITWDPGGEPEIVIVLPKGLQLKALYNAKSSRIKRERDRIVIEGIEVDGYLGLLFGTKVLSAKRTQQSLTFIIRFPQSGEARKVRRDVDLFRPALRVDTVPPEIVIGYDAASKTYSFSDKLRLLNEGDGTAIILAAPINDENFTRSAPSGIADFERAFLADMEPRLAAIKVEWPDSEQLVDGFLNLLKEPMSLKKADRIIVQEVFENLAKRFREDTRFLEAFVSALAISYLRNIQLITELASFMEYLNSIGEGRILLANSIDVLKPRNEKSILQLQVEVTDLANNDYEALRVGPIAISCPTHVEIPIHALFGWNVQPKRELKHASHGRGKSGRR